MPAIEPVQPGVDHERALYGRGIALAICSILVFGVQDAVAKYLVQEYPPVQIAMIRYWGMLAFALIWVCRNAPLRRALVSRAPGWQVGRGLLLAADVFFFATALITVPLGELSAIMLIYPMLVTLIAIPVLGERVGVFRMAAVLVGFAGAMIIVRPGGLPANEGIIVAFLAAFSYSGYLVCTRKVAQLDRTSTSMLYVGLVGAIVFSAIGWLFWKPVAPSHLPWLALIIATTCLGHGLMMQALSHIPASVMQPFNYLGLPWAVLISFLVFHHLIDPVSLIGALLITGAGLVTWLRERRLKNRAK